MRNLLFLLLLTGCAAAESADPCTRECNRFYNSCMDAAGGSLIDNPQALRMIEAQCNAGVVGCQLSCHPSP